MAPSVLELALHAMQEWTCRIAFPNFWTPASKSPIRELVHRQSSQLNAYASFTQQWSHYTKNLRNLLPHCQSQSWFILRSWCGQETLQNEIETLETRCHSMTSTIDIYCLKHASRFNVRLCSHLYAGRFQPAVSLLKVIFLT